jgi:hypothetical protein
MEALLGRDAVAIRFDVKPHLPPRSDGTVIVPKKDRLRSHLWSVKSSKHSIFELVAAKQCQQDSRCNQSRRGIVLRPDGGQISPSVGINQFDQP